MRPRLQSAGRQLWGAAFLWRQRHRPRLDRHHPLARHPVGSKSSRSRRDGAGSKKGHSDPQHIPATVRLAARCAVACATVKGARQLSTCLPHIWCQPSVLAEEGDMTGRLLGTWVSLARLGTHASQCMTRCSSDCPALVSIPAACTQRSAFPLCCRRQGIPPKETSHLQSEDQVRGSRQRSNG